MDRASIHLGGKPRSTSIDQGPRHTMATPPHHGYSQFDRWSQRMAAKPGLVVSPFGLNSSSATGGHYGHRQPALMAPPRVGDRLPLNVQVWVLSPEDTANPGKPRQPVGVTLRELLRGKRRAILVGIPGPFTPGCSRSHVPGFVEAHDELRAKGIDQVFVVSTTDAYVMEAFMQSLGPIAAGRVTMLADGNHELAKALGLTFDASTRGMGTRLQRFAMVVDGDGVVKDVQVDAAGAIKTTRAGHLMSRL